MGSKGAGLPGRGRDQRPQDPGVFKGAGPTGGSRGRGCRARRGGVRGWEVSQGRGGLLARVPGGGGGAGGAHHGRRSALPARSAAPGSARFPACTAGPLAPPPTTEDGKGCAHGRTPSWEGRFLVSCSACSRHLGAVRDGRRHLGEVKEGDGSGHLKKVGSGGRAGLGAPPRSQHSLVSGDRAWVTTSTHGPSSGPKAVTVAMTPT